MNKVVANNVSSDIESNLHNSTQIWTRISNMQAILLHGRCNSGISINCIFYTKNTIHVHAWKNVLPSFSNSTDLNLCWRFEIIKEMHSSACFKLTQWKQNISREMLPFQWLIAAIIEAAIRFNTARIKEMETKSRFVKSCGTLIFVPE